MAHTVEHVHESSSGGNNAVAIVLGILVLAIVLLFFYFGLPALRGTTNPNPQLNVPSQVDVNMQK